MVLASVSTHSPASGETILFATADTYVRTDVDARRNDNYGLTSLMHVGTGRGGGGLPFGSADAQRTLIRFDVSGLTLPVARALLDLTINSNGYGGGSPTTIYTVDVHRIIPAAPLTPWVEGNGYEGPNSSTIGAPPGAVSADEAFGVAWAGAGDNPDPDAQNNTTQPPFFPLPAARALILQGRDGPGTVIRWDLTDLVNAWIAGTPNEGILLRDPTTDGGFREVNFATREGPLFGFPEDLPGPRLVVTAIPEPPTLVLCVLATSLGLVGPWRYRRR